MIIIFYEFLRYFYIFFNNSIIRVVFGVGGYGGLDLKGCNVG